MAHSHGRFAWYELATTDMESARAFYSDVLGWGTQDVPASGLAYTLFTAAGAAVSGLMELPKEATASGLHSSAVLIVSRASAQRPALNSASAMFPRSELP